MASTNQNQPIEMLTLEPVQPPYMTDDTIAAPLHSAVYCEKEAIRSKARMARDNTTPNTTPVSTVLHSPEPATTAELEAKMRFQARHQIQVGRSPVGSGSTGGGAGDSRGGDGSAGDGGGHNGSSDSTTASSPVLHMLGTVGIGGAVFGGGSYDPYSLIQRAHPSQQQHQPRYASQSLLSDGEIVVFDDIEANWPLGPGCGNDDEVASELALVMGDSHGRRSGSAVREPSPRRTTPHDAGQSKHQTIIGGLTIAEYDGSPRRFGSIYTNDYPPSDGLIFYKAACGMARPGFPKRISREAEHSHADTDGRADLESRRSKLIDLDIDHEASSYSQVTMNGSDSNEDTFDLHTKYYSQQQQQQQQALHQQQQHQVEEEHLQQGSNLNLHDFALSPETDYGSSCGVDLALEAALHYASNDYGSSHKAYATTTSGIADCGTVKDVLTATEYGRMCNSMPILEDGLSSGHASDSEGNGQQSSTLGVGSNQANAVDTAHLSSNYSVAPASSDTSPVEVPSGFQPDGTTVLTDDVQQALNDIKLTLRKTKTLPSLTLQEGAQRCDSGSGTNLDGSPIWVLRSLTESDSNELIERGTVHDDGASATRLLNVADEEETDTDLETDRLLGHQQHVGADHQAADGESAVTLATIKRNHTAIRADTGACIAGNIPINSLPEIESKGRHKTREGLLDPAVLIEGVLFRARYLGSTQLVCEGQPTKSTRMMQAEEAVSRIKAPEGESQPSTEVDLFISTEKIMVLNTDLKEIMMDHALRTISYIADIGQLVVLMARRRFVGHDSAAATASGSAAAPSETTVNESSRAGGGGAEGSGATTTTGPDTPKKRLSTSCAGGGARTNRTPKMICHVFESEEAQFIAQSIGQAFQVAYMEFLKANGIEDHSFMKEMDYQEVLNSQEIFGDELEIFAKKELQKEVVVPKAKGEILGVVIVESGWGSMLPTVVIANLASTGAAARCGQLNIGDQIIAINGLSLVGLPLSTCQTYIKNTKNQTAVKFTVVPCAPVVEVKIKRPNTKYQLGFSVQNGVICSLLRGGIAERGGVRVGHRIIEINNQSVVAVPHEKIVNLLATSVGEILMKTMPTSMFRLLTGQENPIYI
uniref:Putative pdz domain-containing protein n=1 Tax=Anopheles triannulatus TaxID=58253 RepID=A0A2M4A7N0_9DIPT